MLSGEDVVAALPGLYRYALALVRDPVQADDLVQDTVVRALAGAGSFRGEAAVATWLHTVLYRTFVDGHRRPSPLPVDQEALDEAVDRAWRDDAYRVSPEAVAVRAAQRDTLLDALTRLPHDHRSAVVLHDVEGWTAARIAEAHGIGVPAAKQRIRRGRAMLVSALDGEVERRLARKGVPMNCWEARSQVSDYLDDELSAAERTRLEAHLAGCPTCPSLYAALVGAQGGLGSLRDTDKVVPPALAARVRAHLDAADLSPAPADRP